MFDDYLSWKPFFEIVPMAHADCADVAELHTSRFPQAWSEGEFSSLLSQNTVFGAVARHTNAFFSQPLGGFVLSREAVLYDESGPYVFRQLANKSSKKGVYYERCGVTLLLRHGTDWLASGVDDDDDIVIFVFGRLGS